MKKKTLATKMQSELSLERTKLANRRTLLAYIRSSVAVLVAGAGLLKFIQVSAWVCIGWICIILAPILLIAGIYDYNRECKLIKKEAEFLKMYNEDVPEEELSV